MPAPDPKDLGPLAPLAGTWEGAEGLDISYHHAEGEIGETKYREKVELKPFGPVDNGEQSLYGLDYRMAAFKEGEDEPFHTEVGYWLWDGATGEILRSFAVPRGIAVLAGGTAAASKSPMVTSGWQLGSDRPGTAEQEQRIRERKTRRRERTRDVTQA